MADQRTQARRGDPDLADMSRSRSRSASSSSSSAPPQAPEVLAGRENQRIKQMIKASLFAEAHAPVKIGRYTVVRPIGAGGMGVVYAAYDEELDRRIAVKLLRAGSSEHDRARLLREAQAMAKLSHPNVVTVHEVGTFEDQVYVAMEFVRGQNLRDWLGEGPHPWRAIVDRFVLAGRGLAAAHDVGLVHRDFKPANVLVGDDGRIVVSDFGLVRATGGPPSAEELAHASQVTATTASALDTSLTMTGTIMGTPAYMSPEQHLGRVTDARSDQFSLCVALYEALYGRHPFPGETLHDLAMAVTEGALREPPRDGKAPSWVGRVIVRGLARDPDARWPTIDALLEELARDPERAWRVRRNAALIVTAVVAVIAGLIWLVQERSEAASIAAAAEAAAQERRDAAEKDRDRAFADLKAQLTQTREALDEAETQRGRAEAEARRAEEQTRLAEAQRREAESQRREAEEQRGEAEHQRQEAERQTSRAVQEARRARDATRLAQSLGAAADDPTSVLALLRETEAPAETPGWVPAAVDTLLSPVSGAILRVHRGTVRDAAISPDGETIATAADDGEVLRWRWRSGAVERLGHHRGPVVAVAFAADGDRLLTAGADGRTFIWREGQETVELAHPRPLSAAAFSPDGRWIATAAQDDVVRLWPAAGGPARELGRHRGPIHDLAFSPDSARVATASADSTARVWETRAGSRGVVLDRHGGAVRALAFDAAGERLATAAQDGVVRIWRLGAGDAPQELRGHEGEVVAVAFTPDGEHVLSASLDQTARLWPTDGGAPVVLRGHRGRIYTAAISGDGRSLLTASQDGTARLWDRRDLDAPPRELKGHTEELSSARFAADGALAVTTSRDNTVRVWPLRRDADAAALLRHDAAVACVAYDPRGEHLLTCAGEREVWWWRAGASAPLRRLRHSAAVVDARFADDGAAIVTVTSDGAIRRWPRKGDAEVLVTAGARDLRRAAYHPPSGRLLSAAMVEQAWLRDAASPGEEHVLRGHTGTLHALAFSADGRLVATGSSDRSARLWGADGRHRALLGPHSGRVTAIAVRGDALEVATASWDKRVRVWGVDGRLKATLVGHEGPVWSVAYSPDGSHLVSAAEDRSVRVWPADGRGEAILLRGHHGPVLAATYRPDGRAIASASADGDARIWDADFDPESLQERLWRASPVCLPPRERVRLLAEDEATAAAAHEACVAEARARSRD
ncbi:MAG: protein kinase [Nannocystaceae bacterium]